MKFYAAIAAVLFVAMFVVGCDDGGAARINALEAKNVKLESENRDLHAKLNAEVEKSHNDLVRLKQAMEEIEAINKEAASSVVKETVERYRTLLDKKDEEIARLTVELETAKAGGASP